MTIRRLLAGTAAIIATLFMLAGPASAATYPPAAAGTITVDKTTVTVGGTVNVSGTGFGNCSVTLTVRVGNKVIGSPIVLTPKNGTVTGSVTLTKTGQNVIELTGCKANGGTQVLSARVTVRGAGSGGGLPGSSGSGLPGTGGDLTSLYAGIGLLAAGGLLVGVTRQRRKVTL